MTVSDTKQNARARRVLTGDRNQCPACAEFFNSTKAFDKHRLGPYGTSSAPAARRCMAADEMSARGMSMNASGFWVTERLTAHDIERKVASRDAAKAEATCGEAARSGS